MYDRRRIARLCHAFVLGFLAIDVALAAPCDDPQHRAFDFWIGEWQVRTPDGKLAGVNRIEREYGGCILHERYDTARGYSGESLNIYDAGRKVWHQTWVDISGTLLVLEGGIREGKMVLEGQTVAAGSQVTRHRITWTPNQDGSVRQLWESADAQGGWITAFDGHYKRQVGTQPSPDETAIRNIIEDENATWNNGDAVGYSRHFAEAGTFTNIRGQFFTGHAAFLKQHEVIFEGIFKKTTLSQDVVSLKFARPDIAIVETLTAVVGIAEGIPGVTRDDKGRLRTRLLQVLAKESGTWKIVSYHNVDVKPGIPVPDPK